MCGDLDHSRCVQAVSGSPGKQSFFGSVLLVGWGCGNWFFDPMEAVADVLYDGERWCGCGFDWED